MNKSEYLFVGGPWDARRVTVEASADRIRAPELEACGLITDAPAGERAITGVEYRRSTLHAPGREWSVFVASSIADGDLIERLIAGYQGSEARSRT